jgi:hypothetical protein
VLRRSLPVAAVAAAVFALVPATASATPAQAPVETFVFPQYHAASSTALLPDGRTLFVSLTEDRSRPDVRATLSVGTYREVSYPCPEWMQQPGPCTVQMDSQSGSVELGEDQYDIDRSLGGAWVTEVEVPIVVGYNYGAGFPTPIEENRPASVVFTGTGPVTRGAEHGGSCVLAEGCQAITVDSSRAVLAEISYDGESSSGAGSFFRGHSVYAASPTSDGGYGY